MQWLRRLFAREKLDKQLDAELRFHVEQQTAENVAAGMSSAEARRRALAQFGGLEYMKEETRDARGTQFVESLLQDIRFAFRMLRKSPGFTVVVVLTLALGIGANTAIFSVVDWLLLRPLPGVKDAGQMTYLSVQLKEGGTHRQFSYPNFEDIRKQSASVFSDVAGLQLFQRDGLRAEGKNLRIWTNYVTGNYFEMLGVRPAVGRLILPSEGKVAGADPVLVLSYSYWQAQFGGDPSVVGMKATVNGQPVTIIGVTPKGFSGTLAILDTQGYLPFGMANAISVDKSDFLTNRGETNDAGLMLIARLKPRVKLAAAQPVLNVVAEQLAEKYPKIDSWKSMHAAKLTAAPPGNDSLPVIAAIAGLFLSLAGLVLLLACVNVANLLLVRAGARSREMAVRAALGAGKKRLMRQLLTESILLALLGCAGGIVLGIVASRALSSINVGSAVPFRLDFNFNWRVFAYAFTAALFTGIAVGLVPALRASRSNLNEILHEGGRTSTGGQQRLRNTLVGAQVAGSLMLLVIAGLFVRSLQKVQHMDLGFDPSHVLNFSMDPHEAGYSSAKGAQFFHDLVERVRALPGVHSASIAASVPLGLNTLDSTIKIAGHEVAQGREAPAAGYDAVTPGYFETLHIAILQGRDFLESDTKDSQHVAIINEAMARKYWPGQDPIGQQFTSEEDSNHTLQIVGVVKDSRTDDITGRVQPFFYQAFAQKFMTPATLQVRTVAAPESMASGILEVIRVAAPALPVFDVQTMTQSLGTFDTIGPFQLGAGLAASLGILGLILAVLGIYGVVSYAASQRTHEIGIRMALGAQPAQILGMFLRQGLLIVGVGTSVGIVATLAISRVLSSFLVGVTGSDPFTYAGVSILLAIVTLAACYIPARRATKVDPMVALRYE
ncbi:MAG TPA: ABC transporter permease [Candidatus Acidoferrales bacterium]|nr:ABC transporter permease [Candidatus Acidoferrales bacterium]